MSHLPAHCNLESQRIKKVDKVKKIKKVDNHQVSPLPQGLPHPLLVGNPVKEGAGAGNLQGGKPTRWQSKSGNQNQKRAIFKVENPSKKEITNSSNSSGRSVSPRRMVVVVGGVNKQRRLLSLSVCSCASVLYRRQLISPLNAATAVKMSSPAEY